MGEKYHVHLTKEEQKELRDLLNQTTLAKHKRIRAQVLLKADESSEGFAWSDEKIVEAFEVSLSTVRRIRKAFINDGFESTLTRKTFTNRPHKLNPVMDEVMTLATSTPPDGHGSWSLRLLKDQIVELNIVDSLCVETLRKELKKTRFHFI